MFTGDASTVALAADPALSNGSVVRESILDHAVSPVLRHKGAFPFSFIFRVTWKSNVEYHVGIVLVKSPYFTPSSSPPTIFAFFPFLHNTKP